MFPTFEFGACLRKNRCHIDHYLPSDLTPLQIETNNGFRWVSKWCMISFIHSMNWVGLTMNRTARLRFNSGLLGGETKNKNTKQSRLDDD